MIRVFFDADGRKFILSSAAEYLGLPKPKSIKYLPLKNLSNLISEYIYGTNWFRLLSKTEYDWIERNNVVKREEIDYVDVIENQGQYFVTRPVFENNYFGLSNAFYNFGGDFYDCVPINSHQKDIIDTYYNTHYQERKLLRIDGDTSRLEPEPWPEETNTTHFRR